ncbi:MAG: tRNA (N(6)-L-threonylcarbamoyladenosine(37)-C(2))-methylthiotransferase MtaB, partial [Runella sp.]
LPQRPRPHRSKMLHILSDKKRRAFYESQLGSERIVLFEDEVSNGQMQGFTENYVRVSVKYDPLLINELKTLRLTHINDEGLVEAEEIETEILTHA